MEVSLTGLIRNHFRQKIPQLFMIHQHSGFILHHSLGVWCIMQQTLPFYRLSRMQMSTAPKYFRSFTQSARLSPYRSGPTEFL